MWSVLPWFEHAVQTEYRPYFFLSNSLLTYLELFYKNMENVQLKSCSSRVGDIPRVNVWVIAPSVYDYAASAACVSLVCVTDVAMAPLFFCAHFPSKVPKSVVNTIET